MFELTWTLCAATCFATISLWRLLTDRFPHPADIATLSVFYYALPLAIVAAVFQDDGGLVFLNPAASDPVIALQSMHYAVLAVACLQLGRWLASKFRASETRLQFPLTARDAAKTRVFVALLIAQMSVGVLLYGSDTFFSGYAVESVEGTAALGNALIYSSIELIGLSLAYAFLINRASPARSLPKLLIIAAIVLLLMAVIRGKRLEIVSAFLPIGLMIFGTRTFFRTIRRRVITLGIVALLISLLASLRLGEVPNLPSLLFNLFSEGLYAGHSLPGIIDKLNSGQIDYEYGVRVMGGLLAFVPRFIWPGKDQVLYAGNHALEGVSPLGATSMLAEVVLQGGAVAVVIWFLSMGFVFQRLYSSQDKLDQSLRARHLPAGMIGYLVAVSIFVPHFRDGLIPAIKIALQSSTFFAVLAGLTWRPFISLRVALRRRVRRATRTGTRSLQR